MAKHGRRKQSKGFVAIPVATNITLSTLDANVTLVASLIGTLTEDFYCISADLQWTLRTLTAGEGPIQIGLAHGDYAVGEIQENLDVVYLGPGDKIAQERARRQIRRVGMFSGLAADEVLENGTSIRTKIKFMIDDGKTLNVFASNRSGATLTTGAIVQIHGTVYGRWVY